MKYRLKTQIIDKAIIEVVKRQKKNSELDLQPLTKKNLKELAAVQKEIEKFGLPKKFVIRKLPGKIGSGVFLHPQADPIEKGEVIAPYAGVVTIVQQNAMDDADYAFDPVTDLHLTKEEQKKFDPKHKYHPRRLYSLKLDALKKGKFYSLY